jgi:hypothetical protein
MQMERLVKELDKTKAELAAYRQKAGAAIHVHAYPHSWDWIGAQRLSRLLKYFFFFFSKKRNIGKTRPFLSTLGSGANRNRWPCRNLVLFSANEQEGSRALATERAAFKDAMGKMERMYQAMQKQFETGRRWCDAGGCVG